MNRTEKETVIAELHAKMARSRAAIVAEPRGLDVETVTALRKKLRDAKVEFRVEKAGIVHVPFGKASFTPDKLKDNFNAIMEVIFKARPQTAKGVYVKNVTVSTTMGPGIKLDLAELAAHHG